MVTFNQLYPYSILHRRILPTHVLHEHYTYMWWHSSAIDAFIVFFLCTFPGRALAIQLGRADCFTTLYYLMYIICTRIHSLLNTYGLNIAFSKEQLHIFHSYNIVGITLLHGAPSRVPSTTRITLRKKRLVCFLCVRRLRIGVPIRKNTIRS